MEEFDLIEKNNASKTISLINKYGFVRFPNFIRGENMDELLSAFECGLMQDNYKYGYGKMSRFDKLPKQLGIIEHFFGDIFFQKIIEGFWNSVSITKEYLFIHDFKYDANTIYGHLHFDRRHQLKFMIYLTDVQSKNHGAFCAIPKSNSLGKDLYMRSWRKALCLNTNDYNKIEQMAHEIPDNDHRYKSLSFSIHNNSLIMRDLLYQAIPVTGLAGTLIIFDTHVLHLGGVVADKFERKTLRLHTFPEKIVS